ncbi:3-oxoacyl-[acyl-carrier-protein] synthase 2 [Rosistilla carotiformis]|uniref:3-oxoacyl-[acyl-carrier-protein] synthase 2 n=2 Tax=Rosistilla carotiformis TaxID=2528017 RepID=A0A518JWQ2_9BACT|nr:3-oxoacyl-[acyl-carrier-protein] synthase 2 [Rosistilla carotiformis]
MHRRVVITGMGIVTPLGHRLDGFWDNLTAGRSGVGPISTFDASEYPVRIAAEVPKSWSMESVGENSRQWATAPRQTRFALAAGIMAVRDSGIDLERFDPRLSGVYLGCGEPFTPFSPLVDSISQSLNDHSFQPAAYTDTALRLFDPESQRQFDPKMPAIALAGRFNLQGPSVNCIAACVSSSQAIGQAVRMIRRGEVNTMLCGGAHSCIHELGVTGFSRLSALSQQNANPKQAARPFDRSRDGFVIGEGGALFVAEEFEQARRRGAPIYAEISGYGSAQDAFRITDTHPEGRGCVQAIRRALKDAGIDGEDLDYINAHGTGTVLNDKVETRSIKSALGSVAYDIPVSSTKSMLGHATTACGAIELAVSLMAMQTNTLPPTINYDDPDPECDLDYIPNVARDAKCRHILSNNIGFGGQNAALILSRVSEPRSYWQSAAA